jgi:nucleoside-diphosphate-sugar epimerase
MNKVLVTGASGFIGKNLTTYLSSHSSLVEGITVRYGDSVDVRDCDVLIHLAGKAHDLSRSPDIEEYYNANYKLTADLYDKFIKSDLKTFIYLSSIKAAADHAEFPLSESFVADPTTHYGKSKLMAEQYIQSQKMPLDKSIYILRPCMIHGPGNKGNLNLLYKIISKGIPYPLASFENKRSFLSVENLCFVIRELMERDDIPSGVYNVADDEVLSTNELIKIIAESSNRKPKLWKISLVLIKSIAKLGDILKLPLTTERLNKLTESYVVNNSKIKYALGKEFPVQARDGIIKTIKSFHKDI